MATLKHLWVGASVLVTLVACVHAQGDAGDAQRNGNGAGNGLAGFLRAINRDALTAREISVSLLFYPQFFNGTQLQTVPPVIQNVTQFGRIDMFDVPVTRTANPNSTEIGRGRGALFYDSQQFQAWENKWTLTFNNNSGFSVNSSINFEGFQPSTTFFPQPYNYSVVGGTGDFACAKGIVEESVVFSSPALETDRDLVWIVVGCGFNRRRAFSLNFP